jgi:hypothetical protein
MKKIVFLSSGNKKILINEKQLSIDLRMLVCDTGLYA